MGMNLQKSNIKKISGLLIISILAINFSFFTFNQTASAGAIIADGFSDGIEVDPTTLFFLTSGQTYFDTNTPIPAQHLTETTQQDFWTVAWNEVAYPALLELLKQTAINLIQQITEKTVDWIQGGFQGNPAYVSQPLKFLENTADATVGDFIFNNPDLNFLCSPFQIQIKLALGLSFQTFRSRINCTLSGATQNIRNAIGNASANINVWDNWIQTTTNPQNTPIGAYLIAQSELSATIGNKQIDLQKQLDQGFGALAYEECTGTRTPKGQFGPPEPYTFKGSRFYEEQTRDNNAYTYGAVECETKTPGAVITNMLGFKATSDQRMNELQGALGNSIDTILSSLAAALLQRGLDQLTNGVLGDNNSSGNVQYRLRLGSLSAQTQSNYNTAISNINSTGRTNPASIFGQYNGIFSSAPQTNTATNIASSGASSNFILFPGTTPALSSGVAYVPFSQGFNQYSVPSNISSALDPQKTNALSGINYYLNAETAYQSTLTQASTTLEEARAVFVKAISCNVSYNSYLAANLINSNVVQNIDGMVNTDSYRTLAQIPWNLAAIRNWMDISNAHITILNTAKSGVNAATTPAGIVSAMTLVNSTSFNTDPQTSMITNIKTWLRGVRDAYSTAQCPINLDKILASTTATSINLSGYVFNTNLTIGSTGPDVVALQQILISQGYLVMPSGVSLGYFGNLTKDAVIKYQTAKGISPASGFVGPITRASLTSDAASMTATSPTTY